MCRDSCVQPTSNPPGRGKQSAGGFSHWLAIARPNPSNPSGAMGGLSASRRVCCFDLSTWLILPQKGWTDWTQTNRHSNFGVREWQAPQSPVQGGWTFAGGGWTQTIEPEIIAGEYDD